MVRNLVGMWSVMVLGMWSVRGWQGRVMWSESEFIRKTQKQDQRVFIDASDVRSTI